MEIIIPAYNCTKTLNRTLNSLISQTNQNFSVLGVDDCSTEDIKSITDTYSDSLNITYVRNDKNVGCGMSRQRGIDETKSDYITFLDSDDILLPEAVDIWLTEIDKSKPDFIYSQPLYKLPKKLTIQYERCIFLCHGKVYNTEFLRKYCIRESESVKYCDDSYLNWQVLDLAEKLSFLKEATYLQFETEGSITSRPMFGSLASFDGAIAKRKAIQQISRYKEDPLTRYNEIRKNLDIFLQENQDYHKGVITQLKETLT